MSSCYGVLPRRALCPMGFKCTICGLICRYPLPVGYFRNYLKDLISRVKGFPETIYGHLYESHYAPLVLTQISGESTGMHPGLPPPLFPPASMYFCQWKPNMELPLELPLKSFTYFSYYLTETRCDSRWAVLNGEQSQCGTRWFNKRSESET